METTNVRTWTGLLITLAWFTALIVGLIRSEYEGLQLVTPIMLVYVGFMFGENVINKRLNGNGSGW